MSKKEVPVQALMESFIQKRSVDLFLSADEIPFATVDRNGRRESFAIESSQFKDYLKMYLIREGFRLGKFKFEETIQELKAMAFEKGEKREVFVRFGRNQDKVHVDLNSPLGTVIQVDEEGWKEALQCPITFTRPFKQREMPKPQQVSNEKFIEMFKSLFNLKFDNEWILILAFIMNALMRGKNSYVILVLEGQKGSGKTTSTKRIKSLIDLTEPVLFVAPRSAQEFLIFTHSSYCLAFDNLSGISNSMADLFCISSTGGALTCRELYSNDGEKVYNIHRPLILNGINEPSNRADFIERCVKIETKSFKGKTRMRESELDAKFNEQYPLLLGGIYTILSQCMREQNQIQSDWMPRMTEYAVIGLALEKVLGLPNNFFKETYERNLSEQEEASFWTDEICLAVFKKLSELKDKHQNDASKVFLQGTATELRAKLKGRSNDGYFPKNASAFARALNRVSPLLAEKGFVVEDIQRTAEARAIRISYSPNADQPTQKENRQERESEESYELDCIEGFESL